MENHSIFPLIDRTDHDILMHKDVHFGGNFEIMLDYYLKEGKGAQEEFEIKRIQELESLEKESQENLADLLLTEEEKTEVKRAKEKYFLLRNLYTKEEKTSIPILIADLILSEDIDAEKEIKALTDQKDQVVNALIELLLNEDFQNPLFPGYGLAPSYAAKALGQIKNEKALAPLFEALQHANHFLEEAILHALVKHEEKAKHFLLRKLQLKPITKENENAAIALLCFGEEQKLSEAALTILQDDEVLAKPIFASYLVLLSSSLAHESDRQKLKVLFLKENLHKSVKEEIEYLLKKWKIK